MLTLALIVGSSYLLGSLLAGEWVGRILGTDLRLHGSGNPGTSNALRTLGWRAAVIVLCFDLAKGWIAAAYLAQLRMDALPVSSAWLPPAAGLAALLGHIWPVFHGFRGGKGVATLAGVALALFPAALGISVLVLLIVVGLTRRASLGSLAFVVSLPLALRLAYPIMGLELSQSGFFFSLLAGVLVIWAHRSNIANLLTGKELRINGG